MSMLKAIQLEQRYGKPLGQIAEETIKRTNSIAASADLLGLNRATMRQIIDYLGLRSHVITGTDRRKDSCARNGALNAKHLVDFQGATDSVFGHSQRLGLRAANIYRNIRKGMTPVEALDRAYQNCGG